MHFWPEHNLGNLVGDMLCAVNGSRFLYVAAFRVGFRAMLHHELVFFVELAFSRRGAKGFG